MAEDAPLAPFPEFPVPKLTLGLDECIQIALENSFTCGISSTVWSFRSGSWKRPGFLVLPHRPTSAELNFEIARLNLEREEESIAESITAAYHSLGEALSRYESALRDLEIAEESFEIYRRLPRWVSSPISGCSSRVSLLNSQGSVQDANSLPHKLHSVPPYPWIGREYPMTEARLFSIGAVRLR